MDEAGTTNTTDGAFVKISLNRSDVAELLRRSLLPDTDANIDAALGSRSDVEVVPIEFIDDLIRGGVQYWASTPGVFAAEEHSGFTVVDNNTGDCFTETFATLTGALAYIDGAEAEDAHRIDLAPLPLDLSLHLRGSHNRSDHRSCRISQNRNTYHDQARPRRAPSTHATYPHLGK